MSPRPPWSALLLLLALFSILSPCLAAAPTKEKTIIATDENGKAIRLLDNRKPSIYTGNFGDCLGSSLINVTRFDAAYYKDNMTVTFHLQGSTSLEKEALMMYIAVAAYGENRFDLTFNPCNANIYSMCPMMGNTSIEANGIIPVSQQDVSAIPPIALGIPDFEGEAILRIFANSSQSEIACFSAVLTNGNSFSHPAAVGSVLGVFTVVAILASFATAIYQRPDETLPAMRTHYAHSMSVLVVFAVFHHIFYTGALSMNWPSVLVAFWSNYAWSAGMIYSSSMQDSISKFMGRHIGNTSMVGAAGSGTPNKALGGGYDITKIYKRAAEAPSLVNTFYQPLNSDLVNRDLHSRSLEGVLSKRALANISEGFRWYGNPVRPGLPLPGNYSGFAGTLGQESIPASNAFLTGFIWLLILLLIVAASVAAFKLSLEALIKLNMMKKERLTFFRGRWKQYTAAALLRTVFIAFFMMMFLTLFQFTYNGGVGAVGIAVVVFLIFFGGIFSIAGYALYYRLRLGKWTSEPDRIHLERTKAFHILPWYRFSRRSANPVNSEKTYTSSIPWWRIAHTPVEDQTSIHEDAEYMKKFGWLASRFRSSRWWFFGAWLGYECVRACFYAGASGHAMVQVFGLLIVEFFAFAAVIKLRPFEGQRLNAIVVYLMGFSKVLTVALSAAFDVSFNMGRILTTVLGIVIIVVQGILTIVLLIGIALGAVSSYMSVMRHREEENFKPRRLRAARRKYFEHIEHAATDRPRLPPPPPEPEPEKPVGPYFSVNAVRRVAKIEDEDPEFLADIDGAGTTGSNRESATDLRLSSRTSVNMLNQIQQVNGQSPAPAGGARVSRAMSVSSQRSHSSLPYGARLHRASWSTKDFQDTNYDPGMYDRRRTSTPGVPAPGATPDNNAGTRPLRNVGSRDSIARAPPSAHRNGRTPSFSRRGTPPTSSAGPAAASSSSNSRSSRSPSPIVIRSTSGTGMPGSGPPSPRKVRGTKADGEEQSPVSPVGERISEEKLGRTEGEEVFVDAKETVAGREDKGKETNSEAN